MQNINNGNKGPNDANEDSKNLMSESQDFRFIKYFVKNFLFNIHKNRYILSNTFDGDTKSHQQTHFKRIFSSTKRNLPTAHMGIEIIDRQQEISIIRLSNTCVDDCFVTPTTVISFLHGDQKPNAYKKHKKEEKNSANETYF